MNSKSRSLPAYLLYELRHPRTYQRHNWIYIMALKLLDYRPPEQAVKLLKTARKYIGRPVPDREIKTAVRNAVRFKNQPLNPQEKRPQKGQPKTKRGTPSRPEWDPPSLEKIDAIVRAGPRLLEGINSSPVKFDPAQRHTDALIDLLFPGNPLLCVGRRGTWNFSTAPREAYRGWLHTCSFIVPSPMTDFTGLTQDEPRRKSAHTLDNTGPRHFLINEMDFKAIDGNGNPTIWAPLIKGWQTAGITIADACMAILLHLALTAPLVMIVSSGGKSLHGWFRALGYSEEKLYIWMRYAVSLGACRAPWSRSQFVRIPDGTRYSEDPLERIRGKGLRRQEGLYFNPAAL
jgi:hypothetical protein